VAVTFLPTRHRLAPRSQSPFSRKPSPFVKPVRIMRLVLAIVLAAMLGVAAGAGIAALRIASVPWAGGGQGSPPGRPTSGPAPRVAVDRADYEFGEMDVAAAGRHDFTFTNQGDAALELAVGRTSCRCTVGQLTDLSIAPGGSGKVTVKWTAESGEGPYRQSVSIRTNDPAQPNVTLTISGQFVRLVRAVPPELVLGRVSLSQPVAGQVRLLCYADEPLKVVSSGLSDRQTAHQFEVTFEPLTADQLKEAAGGEEGPGGLRQPEERERTGDQGSPRSGYLLQVALKPGLPLGPFKQTILLQTDLESVPTLRIPLSGTIVGDISIVGPGWNDEAGVLTLGTLSSREQTERQLLLVARGPYSKEVQFTLLRTDPDLLQVDLERLKETTAVGSGAVTQTPLVIRVPKGSRRANYLGPRLGEILIGTTHPDVPLLQIRVLFAVEG
jgi:hypothetical protein